MPLQAGLVFQSTSTNATVRGIAVEGFPGDGIVVGGAWSWLAGPLRSSRNGGDGVVFMPGAANSTIGSSGTGTWGTIEITRNVGAGVRVFGPGIRMANLRVGVTGVAGATPAPNNAGMGPWDHGIMVESGATDCTIGFPGNGSTVVVGGNAGYGIATTAARLLVLNTFVGIASDGLTPAPNTGPGGIYIDPSATDGMIGAPGEGCAVVVSGNLGVGISANGARLRVVNTLVGVAADGIAPIPNSGVCGISIGTTATDCTIGATGRGNTVVASGNFGSGIGAHGAGLVVVNTLAGVAADGTTPVPNGVSGIAIAITATDSSIGWPGRGNTVVASGNFGTAIFANAARLRIVNTFVGVAADGTTPVPNGKNGVVIGSTAADCTIGWPGTESVVVLSGNSGAGLVVYAVRMRVLNTFVGVGADGTTGIPNARACDSCNEFPGISIDPAASNCTIGAQGSGSTVVIGANNGYGISGGGAGLHVINTLIGMSADGITRAPNRGGISLGRTATDCTIGAPGLGNTVVVSGNIGFGIAAYGSRLRVVNTLVGVAADGVTPTPNMVGVSIYAPAANCTIGAPGPGNIVVVSGNDGSGIVGSAPGLRVVNARVGVDFSGTVSVNNGGAGGIGIYIDRDAHDATIGMPGPGNTVLVGGQDAGIVLYGARGRVLNTFVGVGIDGVTPTRSHVTAGITVGLHATDCIIGFPGSDSVVVVSGNLGYGICLLSCSRTRVINTLVGLAVDGTTPVPNMKDGIFVDDAASDTEIGAPGNERGRCPPPTTTTHTHAHTHSVPPD